MRKKYFREPSKAQICRDRKLVYASSHLVRRIESVLEDQYLVINGGLLPRGFVGKPSKFMRHSSEVKLKRFRSNKDAIDSRLLPSDARREAFDNLDEIANCGYSSMPLGKDRRKRKVPLISCVKGEHLYCYASQNSGINVRPFSDAVAVARDGAEVVVEVPSMEEKQGRYEFVYHSVPVINNEHKFSIATNLGTTHHCKYKTFNIRYTYLSGGEHSDVFNFCFHEVAAYLAIIDHYWKNHRNGVPLQMNPFAIPSKRAVEYNKKIARQVLIDVDWDRDKKKFRKPNMAEREILNWMLVKKVGYDDSFFFESNGKKIRDLDWSLA